MRTETALIGLTDRIGFGSGERQAFAADPWQSRGRRHDEPPSRTRTEFQRDRDRIIHAAAFRRLREKTQVFLVDEGDHYRTRLTHTIEVAQIARSLARALRLDEDLAEALALAHDLGHPPFGHAGERALDAAMADFGGFDHNAQAFRVVTLLERRYAAFDGLNLTWETLEGLVKHNGPPIAAAGRDETRRLADLVRDGTGGGDLWLWSHPSAEAQAAAIADDIAYNAHDIDDGLRAGLLTMAGLAEIDLLGALLRDIEAGHPSVPADRKAFELTRRLIAAMIEAAIGELLARLDATAPRSADDVRRAAAPVVALPADFAEADRAIKARLTAEVYRHPRLLSVVAQSEAVVSRLFRRYMDDPSLMPEAWRPPDGADPAARARMVADFLAGMTDRYALAEHARLFDASMDLG